MSCFLNMVTSSDVIVPRREEQQHQHHHHQYYNGGEYGGAMMTTSVAPRIRVEIANGIRKGEKFITELSGCERVRDFVSMKLCKNEYLRGKEVKVYLDEYELLGDTSVDVLGHEDKIFVVVCDDEGDEMEEEEEVDDGFARLRAELEKREEEKKKQKPNRSGWAFVGKRKEPEKEEKETLDEDDEEEENDSDIIPTQQIGDDDDEMQDADVIDSQPREKSNNVRGGFFKFFGNKTPSVAQHPVKQPSPTRSGKNVRISSPREGGDDDGDDLPQMQIDDDDDDDEDEPTAFNEQKIALVPMVVQQQSYQSPPKPQQPKLRVQSPPHQYHQQRASPPQQVARRVTGKFSEEEVLAVIRGVETYGLGKWKLIRESSSDGVLLGRTPVDIKDKYRNLKSSDLKRVLTGVVPRSASYPFVEEHFEKVRRAAEEAH